MRTQRVLPSLLWLLGLGALTGCEESTVPVEGVYHPTLIQVSPTWFMGNVPCRPGAISGAMQTYVATIYDLGEEGLEAAPFALPSSGPVPCSNSVSFSRVIEPHRYRAEVQGYDRRDLVPLGSDSPTTTLGIPILVDPVTGRRYPPRWTTTCGDTSPVIAREATEREITQCQPLVDSGMPGPTSVEVHIDSALGALECGTEPGMVDHFEVGLGDGVVQSAPCGESVTLTDIPATSTLSLPLLAYEAGASSARWGSSCDARPAIGATVQATCSPLDDRGALDVDATAALAALGLDCSALGELRVQLLVAEPEPEPAPRYVQPVGCGLPTRFTGVTSGPAQARATLTANGSDFGSALCSGSVVPGRAVTSTCVAEP